MPYKVKEEAILDVRAITSASLDTTTMTSSLQEDQQIKDLTQDAEDSLEELELKRKLEDQIVHEGRKPKRLRMDRLEGWGVCTSPEEGLKDGRDVQLLEDWKEVTMPLEDNQRKRQTSIQE